MTTQRSILFAIVITGCAADEAVREGASTGTGTLGELATNASNFNGTAIGAGSTIWFSSVVKAPCDQATRIDLGDSAIDFDVAGVAVHVPVPNATLVLDPAVSTATVRFDGSWETTVPCAASGNVFLAGVAVAVPQALPGGIKPVTWSGRFGSDRATSIAWPWSAAVYTSFADNGEVGGKASDAALAPYQTSHHAGTPEGFVDYVIGGARGGGGSNFTGSLSGTVTPPVCEEIDPGDCGGGTEPPGGGGTEPPGGGGTEPPGSEPPGTTTVPTDGLPQLQPVPESGCTIVCRSRPP